MQSVKGSKAPLRAISDLGEREAVVINRTDRLTEVVQPLLAQQITFSPRREGVRGLEHPLNRVYATIRFRLSRNKEFSNYFPLRKKKKKKIQMVFTFTFICRKSKSLK